jgi:cysteinyl-tRNA synthetase
MRIYNTQSGRKEELIPLNMPELTMYVCGPTTYNYIHLGNARPIVVFDTIRRYLEYTGLKVTYVQNFTDVDDKIINRARAEGEDPIKLAERYIEEYFQDADALGIKRADVHPRASQHIEDMIKVIAGLVEKGHAYEVDGDVYFRVRSFKDYGKLSGRSLDDMLAGARIEVDERKQDPMDFALWKKAKPGEPSWDSPWGKGRPGWHIECSVMSTKYLGETIDIHGGGNDLIFPHHENEIAQAEAYTGKPFVKYWMHNGFITINNEKMSKSLNNFFILRDVLKQYPGDVVRYYLIATHYRSPLDFDHEKLAEAKKALGRLKTTLTLAQEFLAAGIDPAAVPEASSKDFLAEVEQQQDKFMAAMEDDFNTARALGHLFEMSHAINAYVATADRQMPSSRAVVGKALDTFKQLGDILGIFMETGADKAPADGIIDLLLVLRQQARKEKDFALADRIRGFLNQMQIMVEDTADTSRFRYEAVPDPESLMQYILALREEAKQEKRYDRADFIRDSLKEAGISIEDTREGARWKFNA